MEKESQFDITNEQAIKEVRKFAWKIHDLGNGEHSIANALALNFKALQRKGCSSQGLLRVGSFGNTEVFCYVTVSLPILVNDHGDVKKLEIKETVKRGNGT